MRQKWQGIVWWEETSLAPPKSPYRQRLGMIADEAEQARREERAYRAGYAAGALPMRQAWAEAVAAGQAGEQEQAEGQATLDDE